MRYRHPTATTLTLTSAPSPVPLLCPDLHTVPEDVAAEARIAHAAAPPLPPVKYSEDMAAGLPGDAELDEQGYWFITDNEGVKHLVYKDEGHKR